MEQADNSKKVWGVSRNVFFLGWVSFLTDVSSEMIFNMFPLFLLKLGVGPAFIGLIEGLGDSAATILKIVSGWASDKLGQRKGLTTLGYALSTIAKPFLLLINAANAYGAALAIRLIERSGKGIRTAPRDALIADSTSPETMGRGFGFHRALDTFGAVVGIAIAAAIVYFILGSELALTEGTFRWLVIIGVIPAVLSVLLLIFFVHEARVSRPKSEGIGAAAAGRGFDRRFKIFLAIMVLFTLGNPATAFPIMRADDIGLSPFNILLLLILFNLVYASISYRSGILSDRIGRKRIIIFGWGIYALTYLGFALASASWHVILLFALYGLYYGAAEGVARAFVADMVPVERRGTAYGFYHGAVGLSLLLASVIAGVLWQTISPAATFFFGAAMAGAAMLGFALLIQE
ncbi:MAG: MFS transporter [Dehalococcoidia bacterium]|nr:MFS transporter [Dehalococcoidia bacterium]